MLVSLIVSFRQDDANSLKAIYDKYLQSLEVEYKKTLRHTKRIDWENISADVAVGSPMSSNDRMVCYGQFLDDPSVQNIGAVAAGLPANGLTREEVAIFYAGSAPDDLGCRENFVYIRNHILLKFYCKAEKRLSLQHDILMPLVRRYGSITRLSGTDYGHKYHILNVKMLIEVFFYLETLGMINAGYFPSAVSRAPGIGKESGAWIPGVSGKASTELGNVVVVGAGLAGLACAASLDYFGYDVDLLEARKRAGGRVLTVSIEPDSISSKKGTDAVTQVDIGAMLLTGIISNPIFLLSQQMGLKTHILSQRCEIYTDLKFSTRRRKRRRKKLIPGDVDKRLENVWNMDLLDMSGETRDTFVNKITIDCIRAELEKKKEQQAAVNIPLDFLSEV